MDENITPSNIGGMGPISLPTMSGELGSGDVPAGEGDAEEENKKKKKMLHTNFESFINEDLRPDELEYLAKEIANHKQWDNWEPTDKEVMDVIKKDKPFGKPLLKNATSSQKKEAVKIIQDYLAESFSDFINEGKMPDKYIGNDDIVYLKTKEDSKGANYNLYYKGHDIDKGGRRFGSEKELKDFAADYILSIQWYKKLRYEEEKPLPESVNESIYDSNIDSIFKELEADDKLEYLFNQIGVQSHIMRGGLPQSKPGDIGSRTSILIANPSSKRELYIIPKGKPGQYELYDDKGYDRGKEIISGDSKKILSTLQKNINILESVDEGTFQGNEIAIYGGDAEEEQKKKKKKRKSKAMIYTNFEGFVNEKYNNIDEARANAKKLLKSVVKGETNSVEGIKLSKDMAQGFLDWLEHSTYGKKFSDLPFDKLFTASFNWGLDRYVKGAKTKLKDEFKQLKAKAKELRESLQEATMQRYSWVKVKKGEHKGEEGRIMVYGGPRKHSVVALDYGEYNINPKDLELVDESVDEAKAHDARTDLGYVSFLREMADWLNSRDLQEAYDNAIDVLQDKGMSEKQAIGFLNSPHGKYMGEYLVPGRDFSHEAFLDKLEEYYNERMLRKFAKDYVKLA